MLWDATIVQIHAHGKCISHAQHQWNKCSGIIYIGRSRAALSAEYMQNSAHAIVSVEFRAFSSLERHANVHVAMELMKRVIRNFLRKRVLEFAASAKTSLGAI